MSWSRDKFPDVPALLADVRRRPDAWLGIKSLERLNVMLSGLGLAEDWHAIPAEERFSRRGFDFVEFEAWVAKTHKPRRLDAYSYALAAALAGSDADAFDLWFQWYDEFLHERGSRTAAG